MDNFRIKTLQDLPSQREAVKKLIEKSFGYDPHEDLFVDFAPLFSHPQNTRELTNYFLESKETGEPVGHIGVWKRELVIDQQPYPISLVGGVAISESYRGRGLFRSFIQEVLEKHKQYSAFFLLWSDLSEMYAKIGFYEVGHQVHRNPHKDKSTIPAPFQRVSWEDLTESDLKVLDSLHQHFFHSHPECPFLKRDLSAWKSFQKITSSDLYLYKKNQKILGYAIRNKGMDLGGIIHDYACDPDIESEFFQKLKNENLWAPKGLLSLAPAKEEHTLYIGLIKVANERLFSELCSAWTQEKITPPHTLNENFLHQLFGPTDSHSPSLYKPIFIGGLESI